MLRAGLLSLCCCGFTAAASTEASLEESQRGLSRLVDEFKPNLGRLAELQTAYGRGGDLRALGQKRQALRSAVEAQLKELDQRADAFNVMAALREREYRRSKERSAEWVFVEESGAYSEFGTGVDSFRDGVASMLASEDAAFRGALEAAERSRQRLRAGLLWAGAGLIALAVLLWNSLGPLFYGWFSRRRGAASAALLLCLAGLGAASDELRPPVAEAEREVRRSLAGLDPKMQRVAEICVLMERGADPRAFSKERVPLGADIKDRLAALDRQLDDLSAKRHAWEADMHVRLLSEAAAGQPSPDAEAFSRGSVALGRFCQEAADIQRSAWGLLKKEEDLHFAGIDERAMRRRWSLIAAGSGVLFVGVCVLIVRTSPRREALGGPARTASIVDMHASESSPSPPGPLEVRLVLGKRFRVGAELGPEEMGMLYEAECLRTGQRACARRLDSRLFLSPQEMERFASYARRALALEHPHLFPLLEAAAERGGVWLVHPRMERRSLASRIADGHACSVPDVKRWAGQIGAALEYAHARGQTHAALCPHDILLTPQGDAMVDGFCVGYPVWLMAVHRSLGAGQRPLPFLAPEAHNGQAAPSSDVFSLGAVLYAALTGKLAFPGPDFLKQKREGLVNQPSKTAWALPRAFDKVLLKAMAPLAKDRYASAGQFVAELAVLPER